MYMTNVQWVFLQINASSHNISREEQDEFAKTSYLRSKRLGIQENLIMKLFQ